MGYDINHYFIDRKITRKYLYQFLAQYRSMNQVLDVGCGNSEYADLFPNMVSVDIDSNRYPDIIGDICDLNMIKDNSFQCILCTEVLEHCKEPQLAINELMRVLEPNGTLLLSTRFIYPMHDTPNDFFRFTEYGLKYLFRNYEIIEIRKECLTMETIGVLYQRVAFQSKMLSPLHRIGMFLRSEKMKRYEKYISSQYGNVKHEGPLEDILVSGYYLVATKGD